MLTVRLDGRSGVSSNTGWTRWMASSKQVMAVVSCGFDAHGVRLLGAMVLLLADEGG